MGAFGWNWFGKGARWYCDKEPLFMKVAVRYPSQDPDVSIQLFGFQSTRKSHSLVTRSGFCLLLFVENLKLLHTKKRHSRYRIRICSNSRYFDFQMDPDRVTGVSLFCWEIRIVLHPKKRHAGHRIRMQSKFRNSKIRFCVLACCLLKKRHTRHRIRMHSISLGF